MNELKYGECPYCGGALTADHKCWQRTAVGSLKGQFDDLSLLRAEIARLAAQLEQARAELREAQTQRDYFDGAWNRALETGRELVRVEHARYKAAEAKNAELSAKCAGMAELLTRIKIWRCDDSNANEDWDYLPEIIEILSNLHAHTQAILDLVEAVGRHEKENNKPGDGCSCSLCVAYRTLEAIRRGK